MLASVERQQVNVLSSLFQTRLGDVLQTHRIVVCTLITAHRLKIKSMEFSHVFIDEAGQAAECEALVAISGLLKPHSVGQPTGLLVSTDLFNYKNEISLPPLNFK